ncbi:MAG: DUF4974 domain-containing protein [Saprospiraceae bacterium]|nr:DUF4974 domain-containing protein [Bacteroidia bacterium]NNF23144.1 DUF4974 domain-containing protein [Saprospiraceae bacterium]NNK89138.1 DUF4974 domain-containing protein [Saprospiraceae bacterium]
MNKDLYISLISKKLSSELNAAELKDLNNWLSKSKDNANLLEEFKSVWNQSSSYKESIVFNADAAYDSFVEKYDIPEEYHSDPKGTIKINKYLLSAILIILLSLMALFIYNQFNKGVVTNNNMHAMTLDLNESANVTLSPESSIKNLKNSLNSNNSEAGSPIKLNSLKSLDSQPLRDNMLARKLKGQAYFSLNNLFSGIPLSLGLDNGSILAAHKASFNIQNFDSDNKTIIDVESGELAFQSNEKLVTATSGQRIILDEQSGKVIITESPSLSPFAWHKGVLAFDNTPLTDVFTIIERFYGVDINVTDNSPVEGHFTAFNLKPGSLNECLELLQASIDMKIVRKGLKTIEISEINAD